MEMGGKADNNASCVCLLFVLLITLAYSLKFGGENGFATVDRIIINMDPMDYDCYYQTVPSGSNFLITLKVCKPIIMIIFGFLVLKLL